jgi:hypothetical protein
MALNKVLSRTGPKFCYEVNATEKITQHKFYNFNTQLLKERIFQNEHEQNLLERRHRDYQSCALHTELSRNQILDTFKIKPIYLTGIRLLTISFSENLVLEYALVV